MTSLANAMKQSGNVPSTIATQVFNVRGISENLVSEFETVQQYAAYLYDAIEALRTQAKTPASERFIDLAKESLEESVLWAFRASGMGNRG